MPSPGLYPPSAPIALLASTPWEVAKFAMELYHHGVLRGVGLPAFPHARTKRGTTDTNHGPHPRSSREPLPGHLVRQPPATFDLTRSLDRLQGAVFSAWFVDADLMVMSHVWLHEVASTLILSGGVIVTFDREKLRGTPKPPLINRPNPFLS